MKRIKWATSIGIVMFTIWTGLSQSNIIKYDFKKGEVLDILLLNKNPKSDSIAKIYFQTAIPIAIKNGYKPNNGFAINDSPLQGNYHPESMIVASWPSELVRANCLEELTAEVDDFHKMRREVWTHFNVAYYTLSENLSFQVDKDMYNVATAYWQNEGDNISEFISKWKDNVERFGGEVIVHLTEAKSTFGYTYTPQYLILTSWKNKESFNKFKIENLKMDHSNLEQVHQFRIQ